MGPPTNIVHVILLTLLPFLSDFCKEAELPVPLPITASQVESVHQESVFQSNLSVGIMLTNGLGFRFYSGHIDHFQAPHDYFVLQDPANTVAFVGPVKMTPGEAVAMARRIIHNMGYSEEMLYADMEPSVYMPPAIKEGAIPFYSVGWPNPNSSDASIQFEIDASLKRVVAMHMFNNNVTLTTPKIRVPDGGKVLVRTPSPLPEADLSSLLEAVLPIAGELGRSFGFCSGKLSTNDFSEIHVTKDRRDVYGKLVLKNGYEFLISNGALVGFSAPDTFYSFSHVVLVKNYTGRSRLDHNSMIALARTALVKAGVSPNIPSARGDPVIEAPSIKRPEIPRFKLSWMGDNGAVIMEIDAAHATVKSLDLDCPEFLRRQAKHIQLRGVREP